ncbi:MAG TPA: M48 family metalloprotease, partial [Burkholderiales bacterium]|nr:M48 family metalloprotease [Burkholderiales bacterium]
MDFFQAQERARRDSRWLVVWYAAAVLAVVASYCLLAALVYLVVRQSAMPLRGHAWVAALVGGLIVAVSAWRMWQLSEGGMAVAHVLGARYVDPDKCTPAERKLVNVVEEMAIASGISVPPVYLLEFDDAINALVAGYSPHEAVIIATRGAVQKLSRDELQGVMGHEF